MKKNGKLTLAIVFGLFLIITAMLSIAEKLGYFRWLEEKGSVLYMVLGSIAFIAAYVVVGALIIVVLLLVSAVCGNTHRQRFAREFNALTKEYLETNNADDLYNGLTLMENPPETQFQKDMVALQMATALYNLGRKEEAKEQLMSVRSRSRQIQEAVKKQFDNMENAERPDKIRKQQSEKHEERRENVREEKMQDSQGDPPEDS